MGVVYERSATKPRVVKACAIVLECLTAIGRVVVARWCYYTWLDTRRLVLSPPVVLLDSAPYPVPVLALPVVLLRSAPAPIAALAVPLVLLPRAKVPTAALSLPVL